jgi:nucleotide-binding universal stress UspA family protein
VSVLAVYTQSVPGRAALRTAVEEARVRGTELQVAPLPTPGTVWSVADAAEIREELRLAGCADPSVPVVVETREGCEVSDEVLRIAAEQDSDLVVIGLHRVAPTGKLHLGNNIQRVLLELRRPLLTITA